MGQKVNPIGLRIGITRTWESRWFAKNNYAALLHEDLKIRKYITKRLKRAGVFRVEIERAPKRVTVNIHTAKPGMVIGRRGSEVDKLKEELQHLTGIEVNLNIHEIKVAELDAAVVADSIARQMEQRVNFRRAMKKAVTSTMRMGAEGIKIKCSGRLGGAEMSRSEGYKEGRVPLHTLRADIDYALTTAYTVYGTIGVKVWVFKGEILPKSGSRKNIR
ncbi:MAG: 30S ribosomal protein S3 [Candidatus Cloacimonetes bacterium 4572_55]|nr:MAG: 30S ribosomal protein S3 [Candidatus Cloacimonetes bacterium 4572_55]